MSREAKSGIGELVPPMRLMMTPGPSSVDPRVYRALAAPIVGHLDPWFKTCMDETQVLMRQVHTDTSGRGRRSTRSCALRPRL